MTATVRPAEDVVGLADLYTETVEACVVALFILAGLVLAVGAIGRNTVDGATAALVTALAVIAFVAGRVARAGAERAAVTAIVAGLAIVFVAALMLLPSDAVAPWMGLVVLVASVLLGWRWGIAVTAGLTLVLAMVVAHGWPLLEIRNALSAALLSAAAVFLSWMTRRPTRTALDCASRCYGEAQASVHELQGRQAELARFSKSLSVSYHLLRQLNLDLDYARKAANEARQLKAQFAAAVSHELRTPLNLIIGFCEMMVLSPSQAYGRRLPPGFRDDLGAIYRNACHLSTLVDDILDLSQVDADRMALQREWLTVGQVVDEAMAPFASLFRDRGLYLRSEVATDLPRVFADRTRVRQILINLLNNAARFTDEGGVTISARPAEGEPGVVIAVSDTGPGIAPEDLRYVFQEFHQFGDANQRRGGSGLGLAVSKAFAELHQGRLSVESTLGLGSTFGLRLPVGNPDMVKLTNATSATDRVRPGVRGQLERRVLIIDRSGELVRVFKRYLDGYRLLQLRDLKPSGTADPVLLPHAVIVGCTEDRERWRRAAAGMPHWQRVPVMMCPLKTARRQADELGVRDYLVKPVTGAQLRSALRRVCPSPHRVLLVEDDLEMQRLLVRMTRSLAAGVEVSVVGSGTAALELLRAAPAPDVVLLDLLLPGLDGYGVLEALRADAHLRDTPVIVVSARGSHSEAMLASESAVACETGLTVTDGMLHPATRGGAHSLRAGRQLWELVGERVRFQVADGVQVGEGITHLLAEERWRRVHG